MKRILVVADWTDWEDDLFRRAWPADVGEVRVIRTRLAGSYEGLRRVLVWFKYFAAAVRALRIEDEYDVVIVWQQVTAFFLGAMRRLTGGNRPPIILMGFIWAEKKRPITNWVRRWLVASVLPEISRVVCYARRERLFCIEAFGQTAEKIRFVHLGMDFPFEQVGTEGEYVFSAGKSGRDYATLMRAAGLVKAPFKVVAPATQLTGLDIPENVELTDATDWRHFAALLGAAKVVVISLRDHEKTAGQLVLLQAMHLGRAIVVTRSRGSEDYVEDGVNGLLVEHSSSDDLAAAVQRVLRDDDLRSSLQEKAGHSALNSFSSRTFWVCIGRLIDELTGVEGCVPEVEAERVGYDGGFGRCA